VTLGPLLPTAGFIQQRIKALVRVRCPAPVENPFLDTAFRSPSATIYLAANLRSRVNVPGLHLRNDSEIFLGPFGFELPPPFGFLWPPGVRSLLVTRCQVRFRNSAPVVRPPLPVGIFQSLRIVAPSLIPNAEACLCESPDFPSLPAALE
jgi:hypothetical protein